MDNPSLNRHKGIVAMAALLLVGAMLVPLSADADEPGQTIIHAAPYGDDEAGDGAEDNPYATVQRAQEAARDAAQEMTGDIAVKLREGVYRITEPLEFDERDGGRNGHDVVYQAYPGETAIISGGKPIEGWEPVPDEPYYEAEVDLSTLRQLYVNGEWRYRARIDQPVQGVDWHYDAAGDPIGIIVPADAVEPGEDRPELALHWGREWRHYHLPVQKTEALDERHTAVIPRQSAFEGVWSIGNPFICPRQHFFIENGLEHLTRPGEWQFDAEAGLLRYYPKAGEDMDTAEVIAPVAEQLVRIRGASVDEPVRNLGFHDLVFAHGTWTRPETEGWFSIQAHMLWRPEQHGFTPAAIETVNAENIAFTDNAVRHVAPVGLGVMEGVHGMQVTGNVFDAVGDSAITVGTHQHSGEALYGPPIEDERQVCSDIQIANNLIHDIGKEFWGAPAVCAYYTDSVVIEHNHIERAPYTGISLGWGWGHPNTTSRNNTVRRNHIENILRISRDGGGVYTLGDLRDSRIEENYFKALINEHAGLYPDEGTQNTVWRRNVIEDAPQWAAMYNTVEDSIRDNVITDNFSTTSAEIDNISKDVNEVEAPGVYPDADWPEEARAIIEQAGLESEYQHLLDHLPEREAAQPPDVDAGADITVTLMETAELGGSVTDDGLPHGILETAWDVTEGPEEAYVEDANGERRWTGVTLSNAASPYKGVDYPRPIPATAAFAVPGVYTLELTASDGANEASGGIEVEVEPSQRHGRLVDVARDKPVTASSFHDDLTAFRPEHAVDGESATAWVTSHETEGRDWLTIDLEESYRVERIELFPRQDANQIATRQQFILQAAKEDDSGFEAHAILGGRGPEPVPFQGVWVLNVEDPQEYRYIRVKRPTSPTVSGIAELRVLAEE